jgi:hypothetical protein
MSIIDGGIRIKGIFIVTRGRLHRSGSYYEYQLKDSASGSAHNNGAWIREKQLRTEKRS